jgi:DNA-binding FrmR family transcriptional regulator
MHDQTLFRPWGVVDPAFWAGAEVEEAFSPVEAPAAVEVAAAAVSGDVAEQLAAIQAASSVDLVRANVLAEELDAKTTAAHGEGHIETVRVREVRAYLALLTGHHETAVAWYLHVVRLHAGLHGPEHTETVLAVRRAYSMWKALPAPDAVRLAEGLMEAFTELQGAGTEAVPRMREHLQQLQRSGDSQLAATAPTP